MRVEVHFLLQPHLREQLLRVRGDLCVDLLFAGLVVRLLFGQQLAGKHDVLPGRVLREQIEILENQAVAFLSLSKHIFAAIHRFARGVSFSNFHITICKRTSIQRFEQRHATQKRGLAAARRTNNRQHIALVYRKRNIF